MHDAWCFFHGKIEETVLIEESNLEEMEQSVERLKERYYNWIVILKKWNKAFRGDNICSKEKPLKN